MWYAVGVWLLFLLVYRWSRRGRFEDMFEWFTSEGAVVAPVSLAFFVALWVVIGELD